MYEQMLVRGLSHALNRVETLFNDYISCTVLSPTKITSFTSYMYVYIFAHNAKNWVTYQSRHVCVLWSRTSDRSVHRIVCHNQGQLQSITSYISGDTIDAIARSLCWYVWRLLLHWILHLYPSGDICPSSDKGCANYKLRVKRISKKVYVQYLCWTQTTNLSHKKCGIFKFTH